MTLDRRIILVVRPVEAQQSWRALGARALHGWSCLDWENFHFYSASSCQTHAVTSDYLPFSSLPRQQRYLSQWMGKNGHARRPSDAPAYLNRSLTAAEQRELGSRMERKQMKEFMTVCYIAPLSLLFPSR